MGGWSTSVVAQEEETVQISLKQERLHRRHCSSIFLLQTRSKSNLANRCKIQAMPVIDVSESLSRHSIPSNTSLITRSEISKQSNSKQLQHLNIRSSCWSPLECHFCEWSVNHPMPILCCSSLSRSSSRSQGPHMSPPILDSGSS